MLLQRTRASENLMNSLVNPPPTHTYIHTHMHTHIHTHNRDKFKKKIKREGARYAPLIPALRSKLISVSSMPGLYSEFQASPTYILKSSVKIKQKRVLYLFLIMYTTEKLFLQRKNLLLRESVGWKETPIFCVTTPSQPQQEARMGTATKEAGRL